MAMNRGVLKLEGRREFIIFITDGELKQIIEKSERRKMSGIFGK